MDIAYANIGLDANTTWRDSRGDGFQKCSDKLWVKLNYLKEKKHHQVGEKGKVVTVRDVIPQSRLAHYGYFSYDNCREMMYNREKPLHIFEEPSKSHNEDTQEAWMMSDVEHEFRRLTKNCSQPYDLYNGFKPIDCVEVEESIQQKYPVLAKKCQPHVVDSEETLETIYLPNPFYRIDDLNHLELQMRITSTKHIWEIPIKNLVPLNNRAHTQTLRSSSFSENQYYPQRPCLKANQPSGLPQLTAFPVSRSSTSHSRFSSSFRFLEHMGDLSVKQSLRTSSKIQSTESKAEVLPVAKKRSSADAHDFTNLTILTRPINRHESSVPEQTAIQVPSTVLKWLQTGYPTRSKEFSAIQNLSEELRNVRCALQGGGVPCILKDRQEKYSDVISNGKIYGMAADKIIVFPVFSVFSKRGRMTTKLGHPQVVPLRKLNAKTISVGKKNTAANRKSAVQILQETKAFYVKSETVLDNKQEFRPGKASESIFKSFGQGEKTQKFEENNNKLQDKLRILLDFDQVENRCSKKSAFKSLPDLHIPPPYCSAESSIFSLDIQFDRDSKSVNSDESQRKLISIRSVKSGDCNHYGNSKNIDEISDLQKHSKIYASFREPKAELFRLKNEEIQFSYKRHNSNSSSKSQHNFSSKNSQSADSGRQSQAGSTGLRSKWSGLQKFYSSSQSICSDSGAEDDIPLLFRNENSDIERKRPILRSKSDISNKYCVETPKPLSPPLPTIERLEKFFDHLGMDATEYNEFASDNSGGSSPIFFPSVSSLDSCVDMTTWSIPEPCKMAECPSIVERNARIIKWLYNCRKVKKKVFNEKKKK